MTERFYLSRDNDLHWYIIPADKRDEWASFLEIDPEDERAWNVPEFARPVGGSPLMVTFTDPVIE